jgi:hypothetical protein
MPYLVESRGPRMERFNWWRLRWQWGCWVSLTIPEAGIGWRQWEWE